MSKIVKEIKEDIYVNFIYCDEKWLKEILTFIESIKSKYTPRNVAFIYTPNIKSDSYDEYSELLGLTVTAIVQMTKEEWNAYQLHLLAEQEALKKEKELKKMEIRRKQYLKLKQEFEPE